MKSRWECPAPMRWHRVSKRTYEQHVGGSFELGEGSDVERSPAWYGGGCARRVDSRCYYCLGDKDGSSRLYWREGEIFRKRGHVASLMATWYIKEVDDDVVPSMGLRQRKNDGLIPPNNLLAF